MHVVAIDGSFDDCQDLVKAMFNDAAFRDRMQPQRGELDQLGAGHGPGRVLRHRHAIICAATVNFCVPSGNFGNVFSGWIAKQMGAPIDRLVVASNANDILTRFFNDNDMSTRRWCRR